MKNGSQEDYSMKSRHSLSIKALAAIVVLAGATVTHAGTRYKDIVFSSVTVTSGIQFGSNKNTDRSNALLLLDLYQPANDTLTLRPLVICIHGGSLIGGTRNEMVPFCTDFAQRGYVSASIDYRIGIDSPKGVRTILEALLRGVQDTKAAVRFFRSKAAQYGIDTSRIYLEGSSAGSMIAVHYAYWNENEIPSDVDQTSWGDIEGTSGNPGFSSSIKGIVNYCGAIVDARWINAGEPPVANFHGLLDTVVPPDSAVSGDFGIVLRGGVAISRVATQLGIYNQGAFFPAMGHGGNEDSLRVFGPNFFYSLMVLSSSSPKDFSSLTLSASSLRIFRYDTYGFTASAVDKSGNPIILPHSMVQYSCDSKIGTIAPYGVFTPSDHPDSGYVYATFNSTTVKCYVKTYDIKFLSISPKRAVTDTLRQLQLTAHTYDADMIEHVLAMTRFNLVSTNPSVGVVDAMGVFTGKRNGTTRIIASFNGLSDTSVVNVESASGLVSLDPLETLSGWTISAPNLDSVSVTLSKDMKSVGDASFMINYRFTYDPAKGLYTVYLNKDILIYGIPDSIYVDVRSDGRNHRLYYLFSDVNSVQFRALGRKYLNSSQAFDLINASMSGLPPITGTSPAVYPLTLNRLEIQLASDNIQGSLNSGTIYVDNLRLKYPGNVTAVEKTSFVPVLPKLEQNYPNPFNPSTTIQYQVPKSVHVSLRIFNVLGQVMATLVDGLKQEGYHRVQWSANVPSGIYFYRLQAGDYLETKKMILLK